MIKVSLGATRITLVLVGTISEREPGKIDHDTRIQLLVKDKAANMIEDQEESNEKEQEATEGKAHKEAEEEEHKGFREKEP